MPLTWTDNMGIDNFNGGAHYNVNFNAGNNEVVVNENVMVAVNGAINWVDQRTPVVFPNLYQTVTHKWNATQSQGHMVGWFDVPSAPTTQLSFQCATSFVNTMYLVVEIAGVTLVSINKPLTPIAIGDFTVSARLDNTGLFHCSTSDGQFIETTLSRTHMVALSATTLYPFAGQ